MQSKPLFVMGVIVVALCIGGCSKSVEPITPAVPVVDNAAAYREMVIESVQALDGMDSDSSEAFYSQASIDARKAILSLQRHSATPNEREISGNLYDAYNEYDMCRQERAMRSNLYAACLTAIGVKRARALNLEGISSGSIYFHASEK